MKIGIDARMLGKGYGLGRYVEQLVQHIEKEETDHTYVVFLTSENWEAFEPANARWTKVLADIPWYSFSEQFVFPHIIKKADIDVMHFPHFNVPIFYKKPYIVTIHDLTMFHYPRPEATTHGPLVYWVKDRIHRFVIRCAVRYAKHIITVSEYTKQDVHTTFGVSFEKMTTTYQAPFSDIQAADVHIEEEYFSSITKPYVLYVGAAYPHKNLHRLVEAWKIIAEQGDHSYQLVLVGKENIFYKKIKALAISKMGLNQSDIVFTGFVSDSQLVTLYRNATVFVFPSLSEGFGFPPLEAFVQKTPVVSSNRTCLPEVLGEGAFYFDPESSEQMAEVITTVLADKDIQQQLVQNGSEELQRYSWKRLAKQTIDVYTNSVQTKK